MNTLQEIFDSVISQQRLQGKKCQNGSICLYRLKDKNGNTLSCAIGGLIKDEFYLPEMEKKTFIESEDVQNALIKSGVDLTIPGINHLFCSLQDIHDEFEPNEWDNCWKTLADEEGLNYTPSPVIERK